MNRTKKLILVIFLLISIVSCEDKDKTRDKIDCSALSSSMSAPESAIPEKDNYELSEDDYKPSDNEKSTFSKRSLGYEKMFSKTASQEELDNGLKERYCNAIKEIEKVDQKIVPGTNIPFKKATEAQIEDAYKEYLQRIAQIRQIVSIISPDDLNNNIYFETRINCYYKGTYWNNANKKYLARDFYSIEVNDYYK